MTDSESFAVQGRVPLDLHGGILQITVFSVVVGGQAVAHKCVHVNMHDRLGQITSCLDLNELLLRKPKSRLLGLCTHDLLCLRFDPLKLSHLHQLFPLLWPSVRSEITR